MAQSETATRQVPAFTQCFDIGCNGCDECEDYAVDEATCPACEGDGGDKWNDYCLPCPMCGGDGRLW